MVEYSDCSLALHDLTIQKLTLSRREKIKDQPLATADNVSEQVVLGAIARFANVLGDPWSVQILRDIFLGVTRFGAFRERLGITKQTLANRLRDFQAHGILELQPYRERPPRSEYKLTEKGRDLGDFAMMIWTWQSRWAGMDSMLPRRLIHRSCGSIVVPQMVCQTCRAPVEIGDISLGHTDGLLSPPALADRGRRWTLLKRPGSSDPERQLLNGTYILGDRWTNMLLGGVLFGIRSFDEMVGAIGISTNILSHRLKVCTEAGFLGGPAYNPETRTYDYRPNRMTNDLFPLFLTIARWSERWLTPDGVARSSWHHDLCGHDLTPVVTARCCAEPLSIGDLTRKDSPDYRFEAPQ